MLLHDAERPAVGVGVLFTTSPAKCEVLIVQGDQQSFSTTMHSCVCVCVCVCERERKRQVLKKLALEMFNNEETPFSMFS